MMRGLFSVKACVSRPSSSFDVEARCVQLLFEKASAAKGENQSLRHGIIGVREQLVSLQFNDAPAPSLIRLATLSVGHAGCFA